MAADIAKIPRAQKIFDTCLRQSSAPKIGCLKLPLDKSSTRCHSDLLPNYQRTFPAENQPRQNHPCGLKPLQTIICRGFKPRPAFDLQNSNACGKKIDNVIGRLLARQATSSKISKVFDDRQNCRKTQLKMETTGIEPATSAVQGRRSPN